MTEEQGAALIDVAEGISGYAEEISGKITELIEYNQQLQNILTGMICFLGILAGILLISILIRQVRP